MLRLSFRSSKAAPEPPPPDVTPEVEFVAYAEDCVLSGRVRLEADRLSDLLNANREFELVDVLARGLAGGDPVRVHELQIARDEILVVHATGPRGRADRRHPTRQVPIIVKIGPYEVSGYVHVMPGADALASLRRGRSLVALSDAAIDYHVGEEAEHREVETVLLNWALADSIVEVADRPKVVEVDAAEPLPGVVTQLSAASVKRRTRKPPARSAGAA